MNYWYTHNNWDESPENSVEWKSITKGYLLYDFIYLRFLKWANFRNGEQVNIYPRLERWEGCVDTGREDGGRGRGYKRASWGILAVMEMLCIFSFNVHILIVILYYSFARYYHWGKMNNWHSRTLFYVL